MWYAINWLCAFCMTLFFQNNNGIWYGGNYINSYYKPKEELEESKHGIQTSGNLLQPYRDLFRPIFRHQHSTFIKYPLVQQTDKVDFNYFNRHLSAREKKFEHFPQYNFRTGKNQDSYYTTKFLLPNYKVLINPFFSRMNMPSNIGESQHFVNTIGDTLSNRRPFEPEMKLKGKGESQYYGYGVKQQKPIHKKKKKKKDQYDKLIYPHEGVGLFLPSKIILDNFSSWKWRNKKEIQTNNLSMSMVYDLLLPKSTMRNSMKKTEAYCRTTKKRKIYICDESPDYDSVFPDRERLLISSHFEPTARLMQLNEIAELNGHIHQEQTNNECCENDIDMPRKFMKHKKTKVWDNEMKNDMFSTCVSRCGCRTKYKDQITNFNCFTTALAITTEVPIIFKFEDYLCECYGCGSNTNLPSKPRKVNCNKVKRKKHKIKEKVKVLKNKVAEIDLKIDKGCNNLEGDKDHLMNRNDDLNIAKYIIISNDGVIDPDDEGSLNYYHLGNNISSINANSFNINECSTEISRIKRRTFRCKSNWDCKRKRAFVPFHNYFFRKLNSNLFTSSSTSCLKNTNLKTRKIKKHKNRQFQNKLKNVIHKGLDFGVSTMEMVIKQEPKVIGVNIDNGKNKVHMKREFVGEGHSGNVTESCEEFEEIPICMNPDSNPCREDVEAISTSMNPPTWVKTDTEKTSYSTFVVSDTEKPGHSTFVISDTEESIYSTIVKAPPIVSQSTGGISSHRRTLFNLHIFERSTEIITTKIPTSTGPKFRPDTVNRHPAKLKCEQHYNKECVCSVTKVLEEINNLISNNPDQKFLLNQLTNYNCTHYNPLDTNYKISPELKPRLISNKHKELLADEKNGPKEIIDETFQELLIRDVPNEEADFYIFPSTNVEIPCFINNDVQLSPNTADSASYVWRHGDNKIITGGRVTEDLNHKGMLQITEVTIADSDNYTCTVNYTNPDTGQTVSDSFVHSVMVVTLPRFALHTLLHYTAKVKCDQETLEMFELYLPQQVEDYICYIGPDRRKICTVEIHNPICHPKNNELQNVDLKSVWKFRSKGIKQNAVASQENEENIMELSLNYELDIADVTQTMISAINKTRCGPFCQLKILLKVVDILRESFTIVLPHPVHSSNGAIFKPDVNSINMKILIACEGGFKLEQGFCMPCPANTYSEEGSTECSKCRSGTYQLNIGSRTCEKCPHPFRTGCSSMWFSPVVIAVTILIILLTILISTILVYFCKFCIAKCLTPCISPCLIRFFRKKKRTKEEAIFHRKIPKKKIKKLSPHGRKEYDTTEPPTPPAEDFTS